MPDTPERLARIEERVSGLSDDVTELRQSVDRNRHRLHSLEATAQALNLVQDERARQAERHYRKLDVRIQVLIAVVAASGIVVTLVTGLMHH